MSDTTKTNDATNLRQAKAEIKCEGKVSEISLEKGKNDKGIEEIKGYISIKSDVNNVVKFNVRVAKLTKEGKENVVYSGIETVMNDYKSIAKYGEDEADIVYVKGDINPYVSKNNREIVGYKSNFYSRINREPDPKAEFTVELYIDSVRPETNEEGETGRAIIKGWLPTYNGIEPLELYTEEDAGAEAIDYFEVGSTYEIWGDVIANQVVSTREISAGFGKSKTETTISFKNELVISGCSDAYDEDDDNPEKRAYDGNAIKLAIQERRDRLDNQNQQSVNKKPSGAASGRTLPF